MSVLIPTMIGKHHLKLDMPGEFSNKVLQKCLTTTKRFTSLEELSEAEMAQLAVYDCYPWEYTTFPVGGAVILIEDDGLAEALLGLSQEDREIFMMHWFLRMTDAQIARYINMPRRTVNTRRHKAYRLLKELMGGEADD